MATKFEAEVKKSYENKGWTVLDSGWPDFLAFKENPDGTTEIKAIEAKSSSDVIRPNQETLLRVLSRFLPVRIAAEGASYGSAPDENFTMLIYEENKEYRNGVNIPTGVRL